MKGQAHWSVSSFDAEPNPVVAGQNITVNLIFETNGASGQAVQWFTLHRCL